MYITEELAHSLVEGYFEWRADCYPDEKPTLGAMIDFMMDELIERATERALERRA